MNSKTTASNASSSWEFSKKVTKYHPPSKKRASPSPWPGGTSWHELKMERERQAPILSHYSKRPTQNKATFKVCVYVYTPCVVRLFVYSNYCPPLGFCAIIGQVCGNVISHKQAIEEMLVYSTSLELCNSVQKLIISLSLGAAFPLSLSPSLPPSLSLLSSPLPFIRFFLYLKGLILHVVSCPHCLENT